MRIKLWPTTDDETARECDLAEAFPDAADQADGAAALTAALAGFPYPFEIKTV